MHRLFYVDIALIAITVLGLIYLYHSNSIDLIYAIIILSIYVISKIIGYIILPYDDFEKFINFLNQTSKYSTVSGFEIFKTTLVALLFIGFVFLNPAIWIIESILVIIMRVWGKIYINILKENL